MHAQLRAGPRSPSPSHQPLPSDADGSIGAAGGPRRAPIGVDGTVQVNASVDEDLLDEVLHVLRQSLSPEP